MRFGDDQAILSHGLGAGRDLPIPLELAVFGAVAALVVSFAVLSFAWRTPRYDGTDRHREAPVWLTALVGSRGFQWGLKTAGVFFFAYTAVAAMFGEDLLTNPFFGIVYVFWWVALVPLSLAFGPVWKAISPLRTLHTLLSRLIGADPDRGLAAYPRWLGFWPAALGLFAFVWMELVFPGSAQLAPLRLWCAAYVSAMLMGGAMFGREFFGYADPFEVYSTLVARLSVWGTRDGILVIRSPLANLAQTEVKPGLVAVVCVLFGSTGYDSFSASKIWAVANRSLTGSLAVIETLVLAGFCVGVGVAFAGACAASGVRPGIRRGSLPGRFAHSMVPIVIGYVAAHYLTLLVNTGQRTVINLSDPLGTGANLFGTADLTVNFWLSQHPTLLAAIKVLGVVVGHLLAVVAAHDRALAVLSDRHRIVGQLPLLVVMVAFTAGGVFLLFAA